MGQTVFPSMATQFSSARGERTGYDPPGSVWEGDDAELLERIVATEPEQDNITTPDTSDKSELAAMAALEPEAAR